MENSREHLCKVVALLPLSLERHKAMPHTSALRTTYSVGLPATVLPQKHLKGYTYHFTKMSIVHCHCFEGMCFIVEVTIEHLVHTFKKNRHTVLLEWEEEVGYFDGNTALFSLNVGWLN